MTEESNIQRNNNLPDGWHITELGKAYEIIMGQSPASSTYNEKGEGLPFFQGKAEFGHIYPATRKWCSSPKKIAEKDDILLSVRAPVGPTNIAPSQCCIGRGLAAIRGKSGNDNKYIFYGIKRFEEDLRKKATGTTFEAISKNTLHTFPFPLPPPDDQKRIVSKIEQLFTRLDSAKTSLLRARDNLKRYRQSVLQAAVTGELTRKWREEQNLPEWDNIELSKIANLERGISYQKEDSSSAPKPNYVPILRATNIQEDDLILDKYLVYIHEDKIKKNQFLQIGDIVICMSSGSKDLVGKSAQLWKKWKGSFGTFCSVIRFNYSINQKFGGYFFQSPIYRKFIKNKSAGININNIYNKDLEALIIPLPTLGEQKKIVLETEILLKLADEMNKMVETKLGQLNQLRQSILQRAFTGQLVM
jgi:type I restriction enzyme S subunit